tara:strand:+ start:1311 stop:2156 length:846 start_codon:yes stop_codon:yes gene_type:complete
MRVLILGSSGQVGAYLSEYLVKKGYEVTNFDVLNNEKEDLRVIPNDYLERCIEESDFIFFLAFDVGGSRYLRKYQNTFEFINNNSRLMVNTFDYLSKYKKRFVFASSQMSNMNFSPYGVLKNVGELYTKSLSGLIVKFWNVFGIEKDMEKAHVITDFIKKGFEEREFQMLTNGLEEREFLYAEDCCEALEKLMLHYEEFNSNDDLHITSFESNTILEIASIVESLFKKEGLDIKIKPGKEIDQVQRSQKNRPNQYITKWWRPRTTLQEGIGQVFEHMKSNY